MSDTDELSLVILSSELMALRIDLYSQEVPRTPEQVPKSISLR